MFCKYCGKEAKEESKFCSFCGKDLLGESIAESVTIVPISENGLSSGQPKPQQKVKGNGGLKAALIILIILALLLAGGNYYQYSVNATKIIEKDNEISELTEKYTNTNKRLQEKEKLVKQYQDDSFNYSEIVNAASRNSIGYAASNFHASTGIIVMDKSQGTEKFTLTANWSNGGTVDYSNSNLFVAGLSFDKDSWTTSTSMTVTALGKGITTFTFTNNVDSKKFDVIVIVK